jgi:signal transduction histidine kinase
MRLSMIPARFRSDANAPRRTLRLRLTVLYGTFFLIGGTALLAIVYVLFRHTTGAVFLSSDNGRSSLFGGASSGADRHRIVKGSGPQQLSPAVQRIANELTARLSQQHAADLHHLLVDSGIALGIVAVMSLGAGWFVAGRALRPLRQMAETAHRISERNLHERLGLDGPNDEVKYLADMVDGLLGRLEKAFDAQRRFVANAAHELRTPLTLERTLIEVALSDPGTSAQSLRATCERVLAAGEGHECLIESLLTLASSERGLDRRENFDLAEVTRSVVLSRADDAERLGVSLDLAASEAPTAGSPPLVERLVSNLVDNALRYNTAEGRVEVVVGTEGGLATLSVENSGPVVPAEDLERLFQPFERIDDARGSPSGHGLGLSIVHAIAIAHAAAVTARARDEGGLSVRVRFRDARTGVSDVVVPEPPRRRVLRRSGRHLADDSSGVSCHFVDNR